MRDPEDMELTEPKVSLTNSVVYVLTRPVENGDMSPYELNIVDAHKVFYEVKDELEKVINAKIKYHVSEDSIHSNQINRALMDAVPYLLPSSGSYLVMPGNISNIFVERFHEGVEEESKINRLDDIAEDKEFLSTLRKYAKSV